MTVGTTSPVKLTYVKGREPCLPDLGKRRKAWRGREGKGKFK